MARVLLDFYVSDWSLGGLGVNRYLGGFILILSSEHNRSHNYIS